jgi:hypothetical protein
VVPISQEIAQLVKEAGKFGRFLKFSAKIPTGRRDV